MGNTLRSHDNLIHVRAWTKGHIKSMFETLRRQTLTYTLDKEGFSRYFGGRNREAVVIFNDLDTDYDGKVDVFEVLLVVTLWSGTPWVEKQELLFMFFDLMGKGSMKIDEALLMAATVTQTVKKFVKLRPEVESKDNHREVVEKAFTNGQQVLTPASFQKWLSACTPMQELHQFIDAHSEMTLPPVDAIPLRGKIVELGTTAKDLAQKMEKLQEWLKGIPDAVAANPMPPGRKRRYDFINQSLQTLIVKMQRQTETSRGILAELTMTLNEDDMKGHLTALVEPRKRFSQEQMLMEVEAANNQWQADMRDTVGLLDKLIEVVYASQGEESEVFARSKTQNFGEAMQSSPQIESIRAKLQATFADILEGGTLGDAPKQQPRAESYRQGPGAAAEARQPQAGTRDLALADTGVGAAAIAPGVVRGAAEKPVVEVVADFRPPIGHSAQMLTLMVGERINVTGQDGKGWWYGDKRDGSEGWFPPSYVRIAGKGATLQN